MTDLAKLEAPAREAAVAATTGAEHLSSLLSIPITPDRVEWATTTAKQVREYRKALDAEEKSGTKPLLDVVDKIRGWFRAPKATCDMVYRHLTEGAARCIEEGRREQMRIASAALATGAGALEIQRAVEAVVEKPQGTKTLTHYSARVVDPAKVPAQFWVIDQHALDAHAREAKGAFAVPGCELVVDTKVVPL